MPSLIEEEPAYGAIIALFRQLSPERKRTFMRVVTNLDENHNMVMSHPHVEYLTQRVAALSYKNKELDKQLTDTETGFDDFKYCNSVLYICNDCTKEIKVPSDVEPPKGERV